MLRAKTIIQIGVIHDTIKKGIRVTLEHECIGASLVLIYCGIDTMAFLDMPPKDVEEVSGADFKAWVDKYLRFDGVQALTGEEVWGARCGVVHTLGVESRSTRRQSAPCRKVLYMWKANVPFLRKPDSDLVWVEVNALADAFFSGVDKFVVHLFDSRAELAEARFKTLVREYPYKELIDDLKNGQSGGRRLTQ